MANVIWLIFGGFIIFLLYLLGSVLLCITIVGIPFGIQTFKLAFLVAAPFGKDIDQGKWSDGCLNMIMNIIWLLVAGIEIAMVHVFLAVLCAITIIGLPFAKQHIKLAALALLPFGAKIVNSSRAL